MMQNQVQRIFIVDDDPFWTGLLSQMLSDMGFQDIFVFSNGTACIDHIHLNPNLVFLDYQMEDIDGLNVLKAIKEYYPGINVVFCTAMEDLGVAVDAIKNGSFDYLLKSNANRKELAEIIGEMIEKQVFAGKFF